MVLLPGQGDGKRQNNLARGNDYESAVITDATRAWSLSPDLREGTAVQLRKLWYLQHFSLLQEFTQTELLTVARAMDMQVLAKGDRVFQAGELADHVYFLKEGHVKIYRRGRFGRKLTLVILKPGEMFGELALTAGESHEQEAEALETSTICSTTGRDFRALLDLKPALPSVSCSVWVSRSGCLSGKSLAWCLKTCRHGWQRRSWSWATTMANPVPTAWRWNW